MDTLAQHLKRCATQNLKPKVWPLITLVASVLPTICAFPIANSG
jgi:hypothetical protein